MARVNKANFRTYRDGETVTASEFNKIKDIFPEAINHIEDTLRDGQRLVDIENVNKEQDERLDSHDEQQAQTDQHLEQLDTRCDEQDEVLADHETRITTATSENSRQDEVIHNINERLREVEDNNADIKIVTVFANNIQKVETFVASEGQQEFQLQKGHYIPGQNRIQMFVDGVQQTLDDGFMEVGSRTIRFTEPLKAGMKVTAHYFTEEASDDLTEIMETIKEGPAILEGLIQNGESRVNEFIQSGETTINGFLSEGEREVEDLVTKGENAFDTLVQRAEQVKADSILVQSTKPKPSDNCDIWFDTSEDDFLTLQDYEEARNQAFNNQMANFESRFSEIKGEKGDKGEPGVGVLESDFKDYMGDVHETLREVHKANVEYTVRTAVGEFNHLDYEGQHITANHSIEGHVKSAILKGNTLVNHAQITSYNFDSYRTPVQALNKPLETGKQYTIIMNIVSQTVEYGVKIRFAKDSNSFTEVKTFKGVGLHKVLYNATNDFNQFAPYVDYEEWNAGLRLEYNQLMIIEGDYTSVDIPFFEGMTSVKMPVLTTTGKNLFDLSDNDKLCIYAGGSINTEDHTQMYQISGSTINAINQSISAELLGYKLPIKKNIEYLVISGEGFGGAIYYRYFGKDFTNLNGQGQRVHPYSTDSFGKKYVVINGSEFPSEAEYILLGIGNTDLSNYTMKNIQIEESTKATTYEPHKSNILTCNEEVELRGIGDVQDELNLLTGELTQRIGEVVLDGSDVVYTNNSNYMTEVSTAILTSAFSNRNIQQSIMCKDLPAYTLQDWIWEKAVGIVSGVSFVSDTWGFCIRLPHALTGVTTADSGDTVVRKFKAYLQSNPITVQYPLETESIKTVALSDNVVYSYDEVTHYDCSSEDGSLVPTLAVKVPTDVQAVITDQSATIQTLEQENQALKKTQDTLLVAQLGMMEHMATNLAELEEQPTYIKALRQLASERGLL